MLPITVKETIMRKIVLVTLMLCSFVFSYAQHDMKNMPGMSNSKMNEPGKTDTYDLYVKVRP